MAAGVNTPGRKPPTVELSPLETGNKAALDYLFHLDALPDRIAFSSRLEITGWLFHREGKPIHGVRAVLKAPARATRIWKGRRKRVRPGIGAAYPHLPEAETSGFLIEIEHLPLGRFELRIEVRDHAKIWRTIFRTHAAAFPLGIVRRIGFPEVEDLLVRHLQQRFSRPTPNLALEPGEQEEIQRGIAGSLAQAGRVALARTVQIRRVDLFVTSKSNLFIVEIARLICAGFRDAGFTAELLIDRFPEEETPADTIQIVVTPHEFFNLFLTPALPWTRIQSITRLLYLLGTEQPDSDWFHSNLTIAPYAHAMLDINSLGVAGYRARGLHCFHLPLGYHPILEKRKSNAPVVRDLDLCLLASMTERREKFLATHADFFSQRNCHLRLVPLGFAKTETTKSYLSVEARNELLQRSKILLNLHYSDLRYFEWHRMLVGLANGCCIITETCEGFAPLIPGKHFVMVEPEELVRCCQHYLEHPAEREAIAQAGRDFVREHLTQADNCRRCVEQIMTGQEDSAVESALGGSTNEFAANQLEKRIGYLSAAERFWEAFRADLRNLFSWVQPVQEVAPDRESSSTDRREKKMEKRKPVSEQEVDSKRIATICERRRGYEERFARQEEFRRSGAEAWQITDHENFRAEASPAVSIIVTLYNYERYIRECIRSIEKADLSTIPGCLEILIVNDASTDRSLAYAQEAQRTSALPIRIVDKKINTGLADARNIGLQLARAPYAFIMDADNLIFPRAVVQLYEAIKYNGAAAAYSILCRFTGQPTDGRGLLSYFDWDPRMLVQHPYVDAMALFDRRQLIELGGYDNDLFKIGWFGWEDYELWLRIAAAHLPVTFVPNILCLYRHHESAMSNTTNLFEVDLVRHLIARYQPLIDEYQPKQRVFGVEWSRLG
jgi:GT2 family glycosyltransferase